LLAPIVESTYLNVDMCKFESSQKDESSWMISRRLIEMIELLILGDKLATERTSSSEAAATGQVHSFETTTKIR